MLDIAVTSRHLCKENFFTQIAKVASYRPFAILLREPDLPGEEYCHLAWEIQEICTVQGVELISHGQPVRGIARMHLPFAFASERAAAEKQVSISVHSAEEARKAEALGADFVIAGHIFPTNCKKNLPPRGLIFLHDICVAVKIPVFAIGGITKENAPLCVEQGAAGVCKMSYWMEV